MYSLHVVSKEALVIAYEWYKHIADDMKIARRLCFMFGENNNIEPKLDLKRRKVNIRIRKERKLNKTSKSDNKF